MRIRHIILTLALLLAGTSVSAQDSMLYNAVVHYRFADYNLDKTFRDNAEVLEGIDAFITRVGEDNIRSIVVTAYASPEGALWKNNDLSDLRMQDIRFYFASRYPQMRQKMFFNSGGEAWHLLRESISADRELTAEERKAAIAVIDTDGIKLDTKKYRMKRLPTYSYLLREHYAPLRGACAVVISYSGRTTEVHGTSAPKSAPAVQRPVEVLVPVSDQPEVSVVESEPAVAVEPAEALEPEEIDCSTGTMNPRKMVLAVKTNALYDALALPNIEMEFPMGAHFSLLAGVTAPWWNLHEGRDVAEVVDAGLELRVWPKCRYKDEIQALRGFFVGLGANAGIYDLSRNYDAYEGGFLTASLTAGVSCRMAPRFNMELSVGGGTVMMDDMTMFFGPTKAKVSLVWLITRKVRQK